MKEEPDFRDKKDVSSRESCPAETSCFAYAASFITSLYIIS
jgi:hypothetical protein